jgi:hypothetical protein
MNSIFIISKELYDKDYLKVKIKNDKLKIMKFWMENNITQLKNLFIKLNQKTVNCKCMDCVILFGDFTRICKFKPILEKIMKEYNITFSSNNKNVHIFQIANGGYHIEYGYKLLISNPDFNKEIKLYKKFYNGLSKYINN